MRLACIVGIFTVAMHVSMASASPSQLTIDSITTSNLTILGNVAGNVGNLASGTTGISISGGSGALLGAGATINIQNAADYQPGLLTAADHALFNSKLSPSDVTNAILASITSVSVTASNLAIQGNVSGNIGNLTSSTTGVCVTGGSGALLGTGAAINIQNATDYQPGLLTAADHALFQSKTSPTDVTNMVLSLTSGQPEILFTNLTVFVSTNGSDSNNGLTPSSAFRTIQYAVDYVTTFFMPAAGYSITVLVTNGTYSGATLRRGNGPGFFKLVGNSSYPSNVLLSGTGGSTLSIIDTAHWLVDGFKLQSSDGSDGIDCGLNGELEFQNVSFGSGMSIHLFAYEGGRIRALSNYTITASANRHLFAATSGSILLAGKTVTLSNTPNFVWNFALANACGSIQASGATFSGSATGIRYCASINGIFYVSGAGPSFFPGNVAGYTEYGGQYQ